MLLSLGTPAEWKVELFEHGRRRVGVGPEVWIEVSDFHPLPDDPRRWIDVNMIRDLPPGGTSSELVEIKHANELGWPMEVMTSSITGPGNVVLEKRIGAFYKFNEWVAHALARGRNAAAFDASVDELLAVFASGRPRWQGPTTIASVSELWT